MKIKAELSALPCCSVNPDFSGRLFFRRDHLQGLSRLLPFP